MKPPVWPAYPTGEAFDRLNCQSVLMRNEASENKGAVVRKAGHIEPKGARDWRLTDSGEHFCHRIGVDLAGARKAGTRHFARQCLDWSERRPHISGALGAAIADTFFSRGWAEKLRRSRTVRLTDSGRRAMGSHFGATLS